MHSTSLLHRMLIDAHLRDRVQREARTSTKNNTIGMLIHSCASPKAIWGSLAMKCLASPDFDNVLQSLHQDINYFPWKHPCCTLCIAMDEAQ